ncbi:MAG TPA: hypothetical protein VF766_12320, partial [Pyrinomonadaceae bacterium]
QIQKLMLQRALQDMYDFLMRPLLPFEVRIWVYAAIFVFFMLLPFLVVARSAWLKRSGRLDK